MVPVLGGEGADDGKLVVEPGQFFEGGTKGDARNAGGDLARHASYFRRGVHFRIEGLELAGSPVHEEEDDGPVLDQLGVLRKDGAGLEPTGQEGASQRSHSEKASSPDSMAAQAKHETNLCSFSSFVMRILSLEESF